MRHDPVTQGPTAPSGHPSRPTVDDRRRSALAAGYHGDLGAARGALDDDAPGVRRAAIGALARLDALRVDDLVRALGDPSALVRRRGAELSVRAPLSEDQPATALDDALRSALEDDDPLVAEAACWAVGERRDLSALEILVSIAGRHRDARCRESAVAAIGALRDPGGLDAVLGALEDRPPVRRRAVVALAGFSGDQVEGALRRCLEDRDWQVRQAAEILLSE